MEYRTWDVEKHTNPLCSSSADFYPLFFLFKNVIKSWLFVIFVIFLQPVNQPLTKDVNVV